MTTDDAEEYTESLGLIGAGMWRQIALAKRLGVPDALGLTTEEWVTQRLGGYIRLSVDDRREAVRNLTADGHSTREAGEILGVSHDTIHRDVRNLTATGEKEILQVAAQIRAEKAEVRRAERNGRLVELSNANAPLRTERRYPIVYADPPYQYDHNLSVTREVENHYPTMPLDEICDLPVAEICTPDAMLFLWTPAPLLLNGLRVMEAWGFAYRTGMIWDKQKIGMGIYTRQQHEHVLIGSRGDPITPSPSTLSPSVLSVPRTAHSAKPTELYEIIERMYPDLPRIELFARGGRAGWDAWGNQAEPPYDAAADFAGSLDVAYAAIRDRMANGGPGWAAST
jgi:N6-adenosine-specific RNA methylase IME4